MLRQKEGITERALFVIDREGVVRYIDIHAIDQQPDNEVLRGVLRELEKPKQAPPPAPAKKVPGYDEDEIPENGIILYCTRWCKDCKDARAWLNARGLKYTEIDVDYNLTARSRVKQWCDGKLITPTIDFDGTLVIDFHPEQYEEAVKKIQA